MLYAIIYISFFLLYQTAAASSSVISCFGPSWRSTDVFSSHLLCPTAPLNLLVAETVLVDNYNALGSNTSDNKSISEKQLKNKNKDFWRLFPDPGKSGDHI